MVGGVLFAALGVFALVETRGDAETGAAAAASDHPVAAQTVAQPVPQPNRPGAAAPGPSGSAAPSLTKLTPDQVQDLQRRIREAQQQKEAQQKNAGAH